MKFDYGCIGESLKHSFSKEIHNTLADYKYEIIELSRDMLKNFAKERSFRGVNVTIPYKEMIIPYLDETDEHAREIGAVNTVVNIGGRLYGFNTDFYGMSALILRAGIDFSGKKVVILGTGGTSKTAYAVARALNAAKILKVSRTGKENSLTYSELYGSHSDADIIINTTPSGMYPNIFDAPLDLSHFHKLCGVIDAVYNPLRTPLITEAKKRGINAEGGLYMLVSQAVRASEIFLDTEYDTKVSEKIYKELCAKKENIVLVGMPGSGKSTVGTIIANAMKRELIDTDILIERAEKISIPEIFERYGEAYFRDAEARAIREASLMQGKVIATGGGSVIRSANIDALRENGRIYFIDRPLADLIPTSDRPLAKDAKAIKKRYVERYELYRASADVTVKVCGDAASVAKSITEEFCK